MKTVLIDRGVIQDYKFSTDKAVVKQNINRCNVELFLLQNT